MSFGCLKDKLIVAYRLLQKKCPMVPFKQKVWDQAILPQHDKHIGISLVCSYHASCTKLNTGSLFSFKPRLSQRQNVLFLRTTGCFLASTNALMPSSVSFNTSSSTSALTQDGVVESSLEFNSSETATLLFPDFPTIKMAEAVVQKLHEISGLPWWAAIALTAFSLRVVLIMPLTIYSLHNAEKLQKLQPEISEIAERLKLEVSMAMHEFKWSERKAKDEYKKNMNRLIKDLYIQKNCHPMKNTASFWLQVPIWISVSYSLRNMTSRAIDPVLDNHTECQDLCSEGVLWFPDLTQPDSTWILPVLMGAVTLFNVEMSRWNIGEMTKYRKRLTVFLRLLALLFIPISSTMPSAMVMYWVSSGSMAAGQTFLLQHHAGSRKLVGLSPPSQVQKKSPVPRPGSTASDKTDDSKS